MQICSQTLTFWFTTGDSIFIVLILQINRNREGACGTVSSDCCPGVVIWLWTGTLISFLYARPCQQTYHSGGWDSPDRVYLLSTAQCPGPLGSVSSSGVGRVGLGACIRGPCSQSIQAFVVPPGKIIVAIWAYNQTLPLWRMGPTKMTSSRKSHMAANCLELHVFISSYRQGRMQL